MSRANPTKANHNWKSEGGVIDQNLELILFLLSILFLAIIFAYSAREHLPGLPTILNTSSALARAGVQP